MKILKKSLIIFLTISLLLSLVTFTGATDSTLKVGVLSYEISGEEIIITDCDDSVSGEVIIPAEIDSKPVTCIGAMAFYRCQSIESVVIPDSVLVIGDRAFVGCYQLSSVDMSDNVTAIGASAFDECVALEAIDLADSVNVIGESAFNSCTELKKITIPAGVDSLMGTFGNCRALKEVTVPSNVKIVGYHTFSYCYGLESIVFEEGVTALYDYAMVGCRSLKTVTLPSTLESIGLRAFAEDTQLEDVYFNGTQEEWESIEIAEGNEPLLNATIHFAEPDTAIKEDIKGDVNLDGAVDAVDALLVLKHTVESIVLEGQEKEKTDVDKDGIINSYDALIILKIAVGSEKVDPTTKEEIVNFYNNSIEKTAEQGNFGLEGFANVDVKVNKALIDDKEDKEFAEILEDEFNSIEYEDINLTFTNGETADGISAEDCIIPYSMVLEDVETATAERHGDGYKITLTHCPYSYTMSEDEFTGEYSNYIAYSEEISEIELFAVTDGQGRIMLLDFHYKQRIKATTNEEGTKVHMDFEVDYREIYTFTY